MGVASCLTLVLGQRRPEKEAAQKTPFFFPSTLLANLLRRNTSNAIDSNLARFIVLCTLYVFVVSILYLASVERLNQRLARSQGDSGEAPAEFSACPL